MTQQEYRNIDILENPHDFYGIYYRNGVEQPYLSDGLIEAMKSGAAALRKLYERTGDGCDFCWRFNFGNASAEVDKYGARIKSAVGSYTYPLNEQFNYCPVCGKYVHKETADEHT